jgi:hypothetical protein
LAQAVDERRIGAMVLTMRRSGVFRRDDMFRLSRVYLEEC